MIRLPAIERAVPAGLCAVVGWLVLVPLAAVVAGALQEPGGIGLSALTGVFSATRVIGNTVLLGVGATIGAVASGGALAVALVRLRTPGRVLLAQLVVLPLYITPLLTAVSWSWLATPRGGLINVAAHRLLGVAGPVVDVQGAGGTIFVAALSAVPVPFLLIGAALRGMDPSLEESARVQGSGAARALRTVTLPLMRPAIVGSALLVLVQTMSLFSVPAVLGAPAGFPTAGTEIYRLLNTYPARLTQAAAWGLLLLIVTAALVSAQAALLCGRSFVSITGKAFRPRLLDIGRPRWAVSALAWLYVILAVGLPVATLVWAALADFVTADPRLMNFSLKHVRYVIFDYPKTWIAFGNSLVLAAAAATLCCALGLVAGWVVVRSRSRLRSLLDQASMFPLALPSMVLALGLLWAYAGRWWIPVYGTIWILLIAYVTHYLPFGARAAGSGLRQLHPEPEDAARVAGAGWARALRTVVLPLLWPTLAGTWALVFVLALQEVSASILLYTSRTTVLSVAVFDLWEAGNVGGLAALSVLQLMLCSAAILLVSALRRQEIAA